MQVGRPLFAGDHSADVVEEVGIVVDSPDQSDKAAPSGRVAPFVQASHEQCQFAVRILYFRSLLDSGSFAYFDEMLHSFVEIAVLLLDADQRQLLLVQTDNRRTQHCRKRDILTRIVDHLQQREDDRNLSALEIAFRVVQDDRNLEILEDLQDDKVIFLRRRQQHDIAVGKRPFFIGLFVVDQELLIDQRLDFLRHHRDFPGRFVVDRQVGFEVVLRREGFLVIVGVLRQVDQQFGLVALALREGFVAGLELRGFVVVHLADFFVHQLLKDEIREMDDFCARPEVFRQNDPFPAVFVGKSRIFAQEQARVGQAEGVDGLFDIPNHEQILGFRLVPCHPIEDALLQLVHVLVFVNQHFFEFVAVIGARVAHLALPVLGDRRQNLQRQMLQIVEIEHIVVQFSFPIGFGKAFRHPGHLFSIRMDAPQHFLLLRKRPVEVLRAQRGEILLVFVAQAFQQCFLILHFIRIGLLSTRPTRKLHLFVRNRVGQFVVILLDSFQQAIGIALFRFKNFTLGSRLHILPGQMPRLFDVVADAFDQAQQLRLQQFLVEDTVRQPVFSVVQRRQGIQPSVRNRICTRKIVEREDQLHQIVVAAVLRVGLGQILEVRIRLPVEFLLDLFPDILLQQLDFDRVRQQAEDRIQIDQVEIALDDLQAEGVDCRDVRLRHQRELLDQVQVLFLRLGFVDGGLDGARHPLLHFLGGRFGEGHDQQFIDVRSALHFFDDPLNQNRRFAGACRGGDEDVVPGLVDRLPLRFREFFIGCACRYARHHCSSPSSLDS